MNFENFVNVLLANKVRVSIQTADKLWNELNIGPMQADLEYYRKSYNNLLANNRSSDEALQALRDKLAGRPSTHHDALVLDALANKVVMQFVRDNKKIQAIKELRSLTSCGLKEAKDAIDDSRVWDANTNQALGYDTSW